MKEMLKRLINKSIYAIYSKGRTNYDYESKVLSFEEELIIHVNAQKLSYKLNLEPLIGMDFLYDLSKITIIEYEEKDSVYSNQLPSITRCILITAGTVKSIRVYGFPLTDELNEAFDRTKRTTENFILFTFSSGRKLFLDTSYDIVGTALIFEGIEELISARGLIESYKIEE